MVIGGPTGTKRFGGLPSLETTSITVTRARRHKTITTITNTATKTIEIIPHTIHPFSDVSVVVAESSDAALIFSASSIADAAPIFFRLKRGIFLFLFFSKLRIFLEGRK